MCCPRVRLEVFSRVTLPGGFSRRPCSLPGSCAGSDAVQILNARDLTNSVRDDQSQGPGHCIYDQCGRHDAVHFNWTAGQSPEGRGVERD